jgi:hypothetical protein
LRHMESTLNLFTLSSLKKKEKWILEIFTFDGSLASP